MSAVTPEPDTQLNGAPNGAPGQAPQRLRRGAVSFVRRGDRLSPTRQDAWDRLSQRYVLDLPRGDRDTVPAPDAHLDLGETFGRRGELVVEIGSGLGENIAAAAAGAPHRDHLAVEVYMPGIAQTLRRLERAELPDNIRLLPLDAQASLPALLPPAAITELWVFFPDPWPKTRHHKRRLINPEFLAELLPLLADGAVLRLATDWAQYAHHMRELLDPHPELQLLTPDGPRPEGTASDPLPEDLPVKGWAPRFEGRVKTSFESKGREAGRLVWDLAYTRGPRPPGPGSTPAP